MVQGLGFLSKKSWHTKNLANQEKVWMAEQRKEAETQKTKELAKQIQQEREQDEIEKISGKKGTRLDRGIDWMYQGNTGDLAKEDAEKQAEEFLLGKEFVSTGATQGDFDDGDRDQGINNVLKQTEELSASAGTGDPSQYEPTVKDRNEDFRRRLEDPMFMVNRKQHDKEVRHTETKALYERVLGYHEEEGRAAKEDRKKSKKEKKRHKKKTSNKHDRDHDDSADSHSEQDHRHKGRRRSRSPDRHRSRRRLRSPSYDGAKSSTKDDNRDKKRKSHGDSRRDNERSSRRHDLDDSSKKRASYRGRSESEDTSRRRNRRHRSSEDNARHVGDEREQSPRFKDDDSDRKPRSHSDRHPGRDGTRPAPAPENPIPGAPPLKEGYGLKGGSVKVDHNDLGPDRLLVSRRRQEQEEERRRVKEMASKRRQRSDDERARDLAEMQANARRRDESRARGHNSNKYDHDQEVPQSRDAAFLKDMTRQVHGIGEGGENLSSRVAQNRYTNQRLHDKFL